MNRNETLKKEIEELGEELVLQLIADYKLQHADKKSDDPYIDIRAQTPFGELPTCCQGLYHYDLCEHWEFRNGRYYNLVTGKYADDADYVNYMENR